MTKIPKWFGDISAKEIEKVSSAMSDYENYCYEFQHRKKPGPYDTDPDENLESAEIKRKRSPVIKSWSITRIKA